MRTLENAVVVITGASRGIGHAIAEELGFSGAKVVVDYAHSKEPAEELVAKLVAGGGPGGKTIQRSGEHTAEIQSRPQILFRLFLLKKKKKKINNRYSRKNKYNI